MVTDFNKIGDAKETNTDIEVRFEDRILILRSIDTIKSNDKTKKTRKYQGFVNDIILELKTKHTGYDIRFDETVIKDISQEINQYYQSVIKLSNLKNIIIDVLIKNKKVHRSKKIIQAYIAYLVNSNQLEKTSQGLFNIIRNNIIPKMERKNGGFLDELESS